jgi:L-seryl-tRNA(Ser) seleniumtransferase
VTDPRRRIPGVDVLMQSDAFRSVLDRYGRARTVRAIREVTEALRSALGPGRPGSAVDPDRLEDPGWFARRVQEALERADRSPMAELLNATGVVLHTNLGRAPLAAAARRAVAEAAGYLALELDLDTGRRGSRHDHCTELLRELTGAEAALVVNNNAAAVVLALNTLALGRPAVISRGELVEIGGSFRVPEIMARSGASMREVGATNRTHARDYREALAEGAALLLKVHRSNFRVEGFTAEVEAPELAELARESAVPFMHDLGSGALLDLSDLGLPPEPTAGAAVADGADVVTMSGDKLLGGPQAGIVLGRRDLVERMRDNPLCRAFRPDKLTLAALEATLRLYRDPDEALREIPTLRMLALDADTLRDRAEALAARLREAGVDAGTVPVAAAVGGGAYPGVELPGTAVVVPSRDGADALARRLRTGAPGVVGRIHDERVVLDPRTVPPEREADLVRAVVAAARAVEAP